MEIKFKEIQLLPDYSSYRINMHIDSDGFSVDREFYVMPFNLNAFFEALTKLDETLKGEALLENEFEKDVIIKFKASKTGHIVITGKVCDASEFQQSLNFGFEVEPSFLTSFVKELEDKLG